MDESCAFGTIRKFSCHLSGQLTFTAIAFELLLVMALVSGCSTVAPYEKERLAREDMRVGRNAEARAGQEHAVAYREGSSGATGASGGGCGCN